MHCRLHADQAAALGDAVELFLYDGYAGLQPVETGAANLCFVTTAACLRGGSGWTAALAHLLGRTDAGTPSARRLPALAAAGKCRARPLWLSMCRSRRRQRAVPGRRPSGGDSLLHRRRDRDRVAERSPGGGRRARGRRCGALCGHAAARPSGPAAPERADRGGDPAPRAAWPGARPRGPAGRALGARPVCRLESDLCRTADSDRALWRHAIEGRSQPPRAASSSWS